MPTRTETDTSTLVVLCLAGLMFLPAISGAIGPGERPVVSSDDHEAERDPQLAAHATPHAALDGPDPSVPGAALQSPVGADRCKLFDVPRMSDCHKWAVRLEQNLPEPRALTYSSDGGTLYTAVENRLGFNITARDATDGSLQWRYNDTLENVAPLGRAMELSPDESHLVIAGAHYVEGPTGDWRTSSLDFMTLVLDTQTGERVWRDIYHGSQEREQGWKVAIDPAGDRLYVTGSVKEDNKPGHETRTGVQTLAYDLVTGERLWVRQLFPPEDRCRFLTSQGLALDPPSDGILLTAWTYTCDGDDGDVWLARLEASSGQLTWERYYDEVSATMDSAWETEVSEQSGRAFVRVTSWGQTADAALLVVDPVDGALEGITDFGGGFHSDDVFDLVLGPEGARVYVTGQVERIDPGVQGSGLVTRDLHVEAYEAETGERLWAHTFDTEAHPGTWGGEERGLALAMDPDGDTVYATGFGEFPRVSPLYRYGHRYDYLTLAFEASDGELDWAVRYDGPDSRQDYAAFAAVNPATGDVTVSGISDASVDGTTRELATVTYDAQGPPRGPPGDPGLR